MLRELLEGEVAPKYKLPPKDFSLKFSLPYVPSTVTRAPTPRAEQKLFEDAGPHSWEEKAGGWRFQNERRGIKLRLEDRKSLQGKEEWLPILPFSSRVTLGKSSSMSVPWSPHLSVRDRSSYCTSLRHQRR